MSAANLIGLNIESEFITPDSENFRPNTWPPEPDFPVVLDANGNVISRYGDVRWDLSFWAGHTLTIHFGDGPGQGKNVCPENAYFLRLLVAWWLWGEAAVRTPKALVYKFETMKPLFVACTDAKISVADLMKYPKVIEAVAGCYKKRASRLIETLHSLWIAKESLGFLILDKDGIALLNSFFSISESIQTAYIPPRIWGYQVNRLRECLDDFLSHKDKIEECFKFCLTAYAKNAGGNLSKAFGGIGNDAPFRKFRSKRERYSGKIFYGSFTGIAEEFGLSELLNRWVNFNDQAGISAFSSYLTLISYVGLAYILNFSLMRIEEGSRLRFECYEVERDELGEDIHILKGITTKTIEDNDARWIVSPTVEQALKAMRLVTQLRMSAANENPYLVLSKEDIENPILQSLQHEPWNPKAPLSQPITKYKKMRSYGEISKNLWPKLFDDNELMITEADLEIANRMTFGLDPEKFAVDKVWPLAWHQLRRTGAVNMLASGLVTEASLQYQLKHASRAMSQYYGKNYYRLKEPLSDEARAFYLREMYQTMVREFKALQSDQYVSPHGEKRKQQVLSEITEKDHKELIKAGKNGRISYRQTFLGGCANSGPPCPLGGISNISACMGFDGNTPCASTLIDKSKLPMIKQLKNAVSLQIQESKKNSPRYESLKAQLESAERAINVIETS